MSGIIPVGGYTPLWAALVFAFFRRSSSDEVLYLEATIHVKMDEDIYHSQYGGAVTTELAIPVPVETSINPGDVAAINIETVNPFGQRFKPALDIGNPADELDEDALYQGVDTAQGEV